MWPNVWFPVCFQVFLINCRSIYADDTTLYFKCDITLYFLWQQIELALNFWFTRHCGLGQKVACWFHCWKISTGSVWPSITLVLLMWKWMGLFLRKNHLLRCWDWLYIPNWIGALTLSSLLNLLPVKLEPWFEGSFSCCLVRAGVPSCYLKLLDKL